MGRQRALLLLGTMCQLSRTVLLGKKSPPAIATHAYCMAWSYAGLVAAGSGQLVVAIGQNDGAWVVPAVIGTALAISGIVIFGRVPSTLDHMLEEESSSRPATAR